MKIKSILSSLLVLACLHSIAQTTMIIHKTNGTTVLIPLSEIDSITYSLTNPGNLAIFLGGNLSNISGTSATIVSQIISDGGSPITQRGICWSTSPNPTTASDTLLNGTGLGSYTIVLNNLLPNTTYYVNRFAINSAGTAYSGEFSFTTLNGSGGISTAPGAGVTDFNGNTYPTIVLGNGQEWMAANLKTSNYANGDPIPNLTDTVAFWNATTGAWCNYNNLPSNDAIYGKLYNGISLMDIRNVCPTGWHAPSYAEFTTLINYVGGTAVAGSKLKSVGAALWTGGVNNANNESGFSAIPAGSIDPFSNFNGLGDFCSFWTSTEYPFVGSGVAYRVGIGSEASLSIGQSNQTYGLSVRCIKD